MKRLLLFVFSLCSFALHAQTLLSEGFNVSATTNTPPSGWTIATSGSTNGCYTADWAQVPSGGFVCTNNGTPQPRPASHSGTGMAGYNSWDITQGSYSELISPVLDFSAAGTNTISFWVYNYAGFYLHDSLRVYVNTNPTSAGGTLLFNLDPVYNPSPTGWTLYSMTIPTTYTSTTNYIIFRGRSDYGYDVYMDDVDVTHYPPTPCTGTPMAPTITTAPTTVTAPVCTGSSKTINATDPNFPTIGGITYQWEFSATGGTGTWAPVTAGTGGTTLNYNTGPLTTGTYYRLALLCVASGQTSYSPVYFVPVGAPQPGAISGNPSFCPGDTEVYNVTNVTGTTYTWTVPSGWAIVGSATGNSIKVVPGSTAGNIDVTATTTCGVSVPQSRPVIAGNAPAAPGAISGPTSACSNINTTYSIASVAGATSYQWTVPSGWTVNSVAANGLSINVTTGTASGSVIVAATNGCGSNSKSLAVNIITALANPGVITGPASVCSGVLYNYTINPVPGATSYQWVLPAGWSGTISGTSIQAYAGTSGGTLSVTAYSACATSPTATLGTTVTSSVTPTSVVTTASSPICEGAPTTFTASITNGGSAPVYIWKKNGIQIITSGNTYVDNKLVTGDIITASVVSNATCRTKDTVVSPPFVLSVTPKADPGININSTPVITACAGTVFRFTTTTVSGGSTPGYQWYVNGGAVPGAIAPTFTTSSLANADTITVELTSSAVCASVPTVISNKVGITLINIVSPTAAITASSTAVAPGVPVTFTATESGGGSTPGFQWFVNSVAVPGAVQSTFTTSTLRPGDHVWVRLQSYAPCASPDYVNSNEIIMEDALGVPATRNWDGAITMYPNPNSGRFRIKASGTGLKSDAEVTIEVLTMIGQSVYQTAFRPAVADWERELSLDPGLASGQYLLRISTTDGMRAKFPFVLQR